MECVWGRRTQISSSVKKERESVLTASYPEAWLNAGSCEWCVQCLHTQNRRLGFCTRSATLAYLCEGVGLETKVDVLLAVGQR